MGLTQCLAAGCFAGSNTAATFDVYTQVGLSGESLRILPPSCGLKLAGTALKPAKAIFVIKYKLLAGVFKKILDVD